MSFTLSDRHSICRSPEPYNSPAIRRALPSIASSSLRTSASVSHHGKSHRPLRAHQFVEPRQRATQHILVEE